MLRRLAERAQALVKLLKMSLPKSSPSTSESVPKGKKKVAMLIGYNGNGYYGIQLQKNEPFPTIEKDILKALLTTEAITQQNHDTPGQIFFQRAARTDKNVSAITNLLSLKMKVNIDDLTEKLNKELPEQIKIFGYIRTTASFDSKKYCTGRTYKYIMPTYALAPLDKLSNDEFRVTEEILEKMNKILGMFKGTHNFHNYTSGIKPHEMRANRYIRSFVCGKPYMKDGIEYVECAVDGQSFVMHHIRKMIGITIAIVKGYCGEEVIEKSWGPDKVDIPKAPGFGLMLDSLEFKGYNSRYGNDGLHAALEWSAYEEQISKFRDEMILPSIYKQEKEERPMLSWLQTLTFHEFDAIRDQEGNELVKKKWPWSFTRKYELGIKSPSSSGVVNKMETVDLENEGKKEHSGSGDGPKEDNSGSGVEIKEDNSGSGIEIKEDNSGSGMEIKEDNSGSGVETKEDNSGSGVEIKEDNSGSGVEIKEDNSDPESVVKEDNFICSGENKGIKAAISDVDENLFSTTESEIIDKGGQKREGLSDDEHNEKCSDSKKMRLTE